MVFPNVSLGLSLPSGRSLGTLGLALMFGASGLGTVSQGTWRGGNRRACFGFEEAPYSFGGLGSTSKPVFNTLSFQREFRRTMARVVVTYNLNKAAVPGPFAVNHDNPITAFLLGSGPSQSYSEQSSSFKRSRYCIPQASWSAFFPSSTVRSGRESGNPELAEMLA